MLTGSECCKAWPWPARCLLIGCDAMQLNGETALSQVETPGWEVPVGEAKTTMASDAYKFGLLAIRFLASDPKSHDDSAIATMSPQLGRLPSLTQHLHPMRRPTTTACIL